MELIDEGAVVENGGRQYRGGVNGRVAAEDGFHEIDDAVAIGIGEWVGIGEGGIAGEPEVVFAGAGLGGGGTLT